MSRGKRTFRKEADLDRYAREKLNLTPDQVSKAKRRFCEIHGGGVKDFWDAYGNPNIKSPQQSYINLLKQMK